MLPGNGGRVYICVLSLWGEGEETNSLHRWEANPPTKIVSCGTNFLMNFEIFRRHRWKFVIIFMEKCDTGEHFWEGNPPMGRGTKQNLENLPGKDPPPSTWRFRSFRRGGDFFVLHFEIYYPVSFIFVPKLYLLFRYCTPFLPAARWSVTPLYPLIY